MRRPKLQNLIASAIVVGVALVAEHESRKPQTVAATVPLTDKAAREFYKAAADAEVGARKSAAGRFRGSPWSQDDEFHAKEAKFIRNYAKTHRVTMESLVDALDRGMHEGWPTAPGATPDQKVIACRPRLSY